MKKSIFGSGFCLSVLIAVFLCGFRSEARTQQPSTIKNGIFAESISLAGMTEEEATAVIESLVEAASDEEITLVIGSEHSVTVTPRELGLSWTNREIVREAAQLGVSGNVIERYKAQKDLEHHNIVYDIKLALDYQLVNDYLITNCSIYDRKPVNYGLERVNNEFVVTAGSKGCALDIETSIDLIYDFITLNWDYSSATVVLDVDEVAPKGSEEELALVTDVLGTYKTSFSTSAAARSGNVTNGCRLINGTLLYPGDEFSAYDKIKPFSEANGYYLAASYVNGQVVDSLGGGICQVSTTLYNAVLLAELEVTQRYNHSMIVSYVAASADAAIAESSGKDFRFVNNTDYPIYIEGIATASKEIIFNIYGHETRDTVNRKVRYESEILETINPESDSISVNDGLPFGYITTSSAHIGYKAKLWKIVTINGVETERTQVNSSSYKMSPRTAVIGTATDNQEAKQQLLAAAASGSIDLVKAVIAAYSVPAE